MHNCVRIADDLFYLGGNDRRIALFESAYPVPRGVSYNSYLLTDEKTVLFDTVDLSVSDLFFENLAYALGGRALDYIVVHHMEPDHSAAFARVLEKYPSATVVTNQKVAQMLKNYFGFAGEVRLVKEGDTLSVGKRTLSFVFAPMVHWPEVMFTYIPEDGTLFSADAFGTFGALPGSVFADEVDFERDYLDDARRYYFNIVGKYGVQVQNVLKKAAGLEIKLVCPLHGPVWRKNFGWYLQKYLTWSAYEPEEKCAAVFYASVYGHTQNAAEIVASTIAQAGAKAKCYDVSVTHVSELIAEAFRCSHVVFASTTYNNGVFVNMENFLNDLKAHNFQNRKYALVENGSWAPQAGSLMDGFLSAGKNMEKIGEKVTVLSAVSEGSAQSLRALGKLIAEDMQK
ncbi:MAG TPA: FprA family A-type flavoprotein [Firmicutes bacterium]|nr:FprA family A-type flavoprotein [Bacillota bacterium]